MIAHPETKYQLTPNGLPSILVAGIDSNLKQAQSDLKPHNFRWR